MDNNSIGKLGEEMVCRYLERHGCKIIHRNYTVRGGEIDIIAEIGDYLAFVEVKTRHKGSMTTGFDAMTKRKKGLIIRAAADFCRKIGNKLQPRFDIAIVIIDACTYKVDYIKNAYDCTGHNVYF